MKRIFVISFLFVLIIRANAQSQVELFPADLSIRPFVANSLEPKLGSLYRPDKNELELNIGNSIDILRISNDYGGTYSLGADLFTYTLMRREANFNFPVDAIDYMFGLNFSYKKVVHDYAFGFRGRISHISAHFVDGHYDGTNSQWRDGLNPRIYSREFVEIMPFYSYSSIRFYFGFSYIFHVEPAFIKKDNFQFGFEYFIKNIFGDNISPFIAYDLKMIHLDRYTGNNSLNIGLKFGKYNEKGLSLYYAYYAGKNIHGEYFDVIREYSALGFNIDL